MKRFCNFFNKLLKYGTCLSIRLGMHVDKAFIGLNLMIFERTVEHGLSNIVRDQRKFRSTRVVG